MSISLKYLMSIEFQQVFKKVAEKSLNAADSFKLLKWAKKMEEGNKMVMELYNTMMLKAPESDPAVDPEFLKILEEDSGLGKLPVSILSSLDLTLKEAAVLENIFEEL